MKSNAPYLQKFHYKVRYWEVPIRTEFYCIFLWQCTHKKLTPCFNFFMDNRTVITKNYYTTKKDNSFLCFYKRYERKCEHTYGYWRVLMLIQWRSITLSIHQTWSIGRFHHCRLTPFDQACLVCPRSGSWDQNPAT